MPKITDKGIQRFISLLCDPVDSDTYSNLEEENIRLHERIKVLEEQNDKLIKELAQHR